MGGACCHDEQAEEKLYRKRTRDIFNEQLARNGYHELGVYIEKLPERLHESAWLRVSKDNADSLPPDKIKKLARVYTNLFVENLAKKRKITIGIKKQRKIKEKTDPLIEWLTTNRLNTIETLTKEQIKVDLPKWCKDASVHYFFVDFMAFET